MGKRTKAESALCPYYCSEEPQKIYCEGAESGQWTHVAFGSKTTCRNYKFKFCRGAWKSCPYASIRRENVKASKYGNEPVIINGKRYASQQEARRAHELTLMQRAGKISGLREQVRYELIPAQKVDGKLIERACSYIADFVYTDTATGKTVVEDSKGHRTDVYKIKKKLMLYIHGIQIVET